MTELPIRKTPRAKWIEYNSGLYFITVCTHKWEKYFGEIKSGEIKLTEIGKHLYNILNSNNSHHTYINVLQSVVMPNHFHAIIEVVDNQCCELDMSDTRSCVPTATDRITQGININKRPLLSIFVGSVKSSVTRYANKHNIIFKWQSRYHDHLIRGVQDCNNISQYIENNILKWEQDCFYGQ